MSGPGNPAYPPSSVSIASQSHPTPTAAPDQAQQGGQQPRGTAQSAYPPVLVPQPPKTIGSYRPSIARPPISIGLPVQVPPPGPGPLRLSPEERQHLLARPLRLSPEERERLLARHTNRGPPTQFPGPAPAPVPTPAPARAPRGPPNRAPYAPRAPPPPVSTPAPAPTPVRAPHAPPPPPRPPSPIIQGRGPVLAPAPSAFPGPAPALAFAPAFAPPLPPQNPVFVRAPALAPKPPEKRPLPDPPAPPPPAKKARPAEFEIDVTKLPDLPPYLTTKPDICKPVMASTGAVPAEFSWSMRLLTLTNVGQVDMWATQVEEIAKACGCHRELTNRFGAFPKPGTVEAFICETRYNTCWRILTETISGPVWAYMRTLGYSKIPVFNGAESTSGSVQWQPAPVDCFYYAKQAGYRLANPGSPSQSREEIMRMVEELRVGRPPDYPSLNHFSKGHHWLKEILDNLIRKGDRQVCMSLYDRPPSFAPTWTSPPRPEEYMWNLPGLPLSGTTSSRHINIDVHMAQHNQQALAEREQEWIRTDAAQRAAAQNGQYTVLPSNAGPPPTQPPPAHHQHHQPPYPPPPPGQYMQQHPPPPMPPGQYNGPPPPPGPGGPQQMGPPTGHPQQGPPPQGVPPQGGQPPQTRQGQPPPQQVNQQQQQQQPGSGPGNQQVPPPQQQQNEVITIADSPESGPPTPPPLFSEEEDNADDDNDNNDHDDDGNNSNTNNNGANGGAAAAENVDEAQEDNEEEEEEEEEEETFHDAEEGANEGDGDGDVVMADDDGGNSNPTPGISEGAGGNGEDDDDDDSPLSEINEQESNDESEED